MTVAMFPESEVFKGLDVMEKKTRRALYRIEALRAASRIVAGAAANPEVEMVGRDHVDGSWTLRIAARFARWLETGKR